MASKKVLQAAAPSDTRVRILRAAMDEFAKRGYHATSVREIAERVGVTKTAVLYHFPGKAEIVGALAEPMLDALDAVLDAAELLDPAEARWTALKGMLEVWLTHRYLLRMNMRDLALVASGAVFERFRDASLRANTLVAGPRPDFGEQVRAAQAIGMLADPVVLFADANVDVLRASVLAGVRRLLGDSLPSHRTSARPTPPRKGRPTVMGHSMEGAARRMHASGHSAAEIAATLGVSRATVYRHLGGARGGDGPK